MGDNYYKGYSTSEDSEVEDDFQPPAEPTDGGNGDGDEDRTVDEDTKA